MQKRVKENKMIFGLHSIIEAIEAGRDIEKIYLKRDFGGELVKTLFAKIKTYGIDRKSTRLNSSHGSISYAVFCLKKKRRVSILTVIS